MTHSSGLTTQGKPTSFGALAGMLLLLCSAVNAQDDLPVLNLDTPVRMNFSGSWEKDFGRSDKWEDELNRIMSMRQEQAAQQRAGISPISGPAVSLGGINLNPSRRSENIVNLARLAEYISRQSTLSIVQNRNEVRVERRGEAPLICGMETGPIETFSSPHGAEACGWDRNQLVFEISLPDDLHITHQLSVSSDGSALRLITSIQSGDTIPFTLNQAFNRYQAPPDTFNCIQTISRGRVCSQRTPLD
ncbi:MAG: hypothetical protein O2971_08410 [Proteobacteria bacterium]|nr:hypothetical protein [Pseudomonadota bacterium]